MRQRLYRLHPLADRDLEDHVHYLRDRDPTVALRFVDAAFDAFQMLAHSPELGASRDFEDPALAGLRIWPIPGFQRWLIFYVPSGETIRIVRVLHAARNIQAIFDG